MDPVSDGPISAARLLGEWGSERWVMVWDRLHEAPGNYLNLPGLLRWAKPSASQQALPVFRRHEPWPQDNETAEDPLRERLTGSRDLPMW